MSCNSCTVERHAKKLASWVYQLVGSVLCVVGLVGLKCAQNREGRSFLQNGGFQEKGVYVPHSRAPVWCEYNFHFEKIDFIDCIEKDRPGYLKGINTLLLNDCLESHLFVLGLQSYFTRE